MYSEVFVDRTLQQKAFSEAFAGFEGLLRFEYLVGLDAPFREIYIQIDDSTGSDLSELKSARYRCS